MLTAGCIVARQPLTIPPHDETTVLLITGALGHPMDGIARHPWLAVRRAHEDNWLLYEVPSVCQCGTDPFHHDPYLDPARDRTLRATCPATQGPAPCVASTVVLPKSRPIHKTVFSTRDA